MRDLPIFASGTLSTSTVKTAHLFELELSQLKVMATATSGTSRIIIDDIDKCFIGQKLIPVGVPQILEVTAISLILNEITVTPVLQYDLTVSSLLYETIYDETPLPALVATATSTYTLQLWHSAFGTLCGRMLFTDYDVPIVAELSDGIFSPSDNYAVYIPYPIKFTGTSYDVNGKMSTVTLNIANIDQRFSNLVLTHDGFKRRKVKVYSIFLGSATEINLNVPIAVDADTLIYAGVTTGTTPLPTMNTPFNRAYYDASVDKVQEFEGFVDSISMNDKEAVITSVNYIDQTDEMMIPRNLYTRGRCQFVYKGNRCRFRSTLVVNSTIAATSTATTFEVVDSEGKFPLWEMQPGETHMIQIDQEQMLVTAVSSATSTGYLTQETHHQLSALSLENLWATRPAAFVYKLTVTREYNSTTTAAHSVGTDIDILLCRKTFHDCRLHYHERMFGGFPAVPKQIFNV